MSDEFSEFFAPQASVVQVLNKTADAPLLMGTKPPTIYYKSERPRHRAIAGLLADGYNQVEIAKMLGISEFSVSNVARQPHIQQAIANDLRDRRNEDHQVVEVVRQNVVLAVETLAEIVKDKGARNTDRIAAAEKLLERRYGKANQPINRGTDVDLNNLTDEELAAMLPTDATATTT